MRVTLSAAAELAGVSVNTVRAWIRRGLRADRAASGEWQIEVDDLDAWLGRNTAAERDDEPSSAKAEIDAARARKLAAEAEIAEIELAIKRGDAISLADAGRAWAGLVTAFRSRILAVPTRLAPELVAATDLVQIRNLIERALHEALDELAEYEPAIPDDERGPGGAQGDPLGDGAPLPAAAEADGQRVG